MPTLRLAPQESGIGLVIRRHGVPVGFALHDAPAGSTLDPTDLDPLVAAACAEAIVREAVLDEIGGRGPLTAESITVAICTHDRSDRLARCLASLIPQRDAAGGQAEVLVVDNAPSDEETRKLVASLPDVRYVREPTPGLDFARNRAVAEATGELLAFLDDDVELDPGWLTGLRLAWGENPDAGCVTGLVLPYELVSDAQVTFERYGGFGRGFATLRYDGATLAGNPLYPYGAGIFGAGCNMSYRRRLIAELGGFDEALDTGRPLPGGGDLDMFFRVVHAGHPLVYEPRAAVRHEHRREHGMLRRQLYTWGTGFLSFVTKTWGTVPGGRAILVRLVLWWFGQQTREIAQSLRRGGPLSPDLALAQLAGGVVGLAGAYPRSQRRSAELRRRHAAGDR